MKRSQGGPTGCVWGPLESAAGAAGWESPGAWSPKTWGYKSHGPEGGSRLLHRGVGPLRREWRWPASSGWELPSRAHFALAMRADAPGALRPPGLARARQAARAVPGAAWRGRIRGDARAGRPAAGWRVPGRLARLRCAAERPAWDRAGARWRVAYAALAARALSPESGVRAAPGRPAVRAGRETPPGPHPCVARLDERERREEEEAALPGLPPPRPSRLLPAPPGRTRILGTGTPASERPCPGAAPLARSLAVSRRSSRLTWCWPQP